MKVGDVVKFIGCSESQIKWGSHSGDASLLIIGEFYTVKSIVEHSWNTEVYLDGFDGDFNIVCFEGWNCE